MNRSDRAVAPRVRVIGVGNSLRGDDGAGVEVARRLEEAGPDDADYLTGPVDSASLLGAFAGAARVIVVDAACSGAPPGTIHRFEATRAPLPPRLLRETSTHGAGLQAGIELARALDRLPPELWIYGIEGSDFGPGKSCSHAVSLAVDRVAQEIRRRWMLPGETDPR